MIAAPIRSQIGTQLRARLLALVTATMLAGSSLAQSVDYAIVNRWTLGPAGKWDYASFDTVRNRLFVTLGDRVVVLDGTSGTLVGEIPNTSGVHGIAFAQDLKLGFTSNGKTNSVTIFNLETLQRIRDLAVSGENPDALAYDASVGRVFAFNGRSKTVSVIDVKTMREVATIKTLGKPEFAQADGAGRIFFNVETAPGHIQVIDTAASSIMATWDLTGCDSPTGLALDSTRHRLFSVCDNEVLAVTDAVTGKQVALVPIGAGPDAAVFDTESRTVYSSNGKDGTLTAIRGDDSDHFRVTATVATEKSARTMAIDPNSRRLFLPAASGGSMVVLVLAPK